MTMQRSWAATLLLFVAVSATCKSKAQSQNTSALIAQSLFSDARALMEAGEVSEACKKFAESQRLEPSSGTLLNLAVCHEAEGKTATAWLEYNEAWSAALRENRKDRAELAKERIEALAPKLSHIIIRGPSSDTDAIELDLDGLNVPRTAWGLRIPLDPGNHELVAHGVNKKRITRQFYVPPGPSSLELEVPVLAEADQPKERTGAGSDSTRFGTKPFFLPERDHGKGAHRQLAMYSLAGFGVVLFGTSVVSGLAALSYKKASDDECARDACTRAGARLSQEAVHSARIADVAFGVGALAGVAAAYLFLTDSSKPRVGTPARARKAFPVNWHITESAAKLGWELKF